MCAACKFMNVDYQSYSAHVKYYIFIQIIFQLFVSEWNFIFISIVGSFCFFVYR